MNADSSEGDARVRYLTYTIAGVGYIFLAIVTLT